MPEKSNRKLTEAEQRRFKAFEAICSEMEDRGYEGKALTTSALKANIAGVLLAGAVCIPFIILFFVFHREGIFEGYSTLSFLLFAVAYLATMVIHELIHGLFWSFMAEGGFSSIEFGFIKEYLTPYCTCRVPLGKGGYILGLLAPFTILGILVTLAEIITGSLFLMSLGLINILGAGGDLLIFVKLIGDRGGKDAIYLDHPTEIGLMRFSRKD